MKKPNKPISPARRRFLKIAAGTLVGVGTPAYAAVWEPEHLEVVHQTVRVAGWPTSAAGLRVGQLSDLHCQSQRAADRTARAAQLLLAQKPDIILLTGDYITDGHDSGWATACADALAPLTAAPRGVFAVLGNHDRVRWKQVMDELRRVGFTVLRNQSAALPGTPNVWLVGLDSCSVQAQDPIRALQGVPAEAVKILLMHEPDYADDAPLGFGLQLSGHSHGGQIRVPGLRPLHCPKYGQKYPEGLRQVAHHPVYTTRGVGMMGPQMRVCCPPEVTVLTIHPAG